jgi:hypothetical protein
LRWRAEASPVTHRDESPEASAARKGLFVHGLRPSACAVVREVDVRVSRRLLDRTARNDIRAAHDPSQRNEAVCSG